MIIKDNSKKVFINIDLSVRNIINCKDYEFDYLIDMLSDYFSSSRKTKINVTSDDDQCHYNRDEYEINYLNATICSKDKLIKLINTSLSDLLENSFQNEYDFQSINVIREGIDELLTDRGFRSIYDNIGDDSIKFSSDFSYKKLVDLIAIDLEELSVIELNKIYLNLLIDKSRSCIIFISTDFIRYIDINDFNKWIESNSGSIIIVQNGLFTINSYSKLFTDYNFIDLKFNTELKYEDKNNYDMKLKLLQCYLESNELFDVINLNTHSQTIIKNHSVIFN